MPDVPELVDHLFRHRAGAMVSTLTRILGPSNLDLAEDVVQEALLKALRQWPFSGVPANPSAWLVQVAKNQALDVLRRRSSFREKEPEIEKWFRQAHIPEEEPSRTGFQNELADDQLKMIFACCHPAVLPEGRLALTLKTVGGFGVSEIARAFLSEKATVAQRIVRAKRRLREEDIPFGIPSPEDIPERLDSVLKVLYLMFNEGYGAHQGENLIRYDLVGEAIRLCSLVASRPATKLPKVRALLALFLLQTARLPGRVDPRDGSLLLLSDQDRSRWDRALIERGLYELSHAAEGSELTEYHLQAGIAACHSVAPTYESTEWSKILSLYDSLLDLAPSPVVALNRAVAVSMIHGPEAGLEALEGLEDDPFLMRYYLFNATRGELYSRKGDFGRAEKFYRQALELPCSGPERRFLARKLEDCLESLGRRST
jgi:RNA polymerase sigma-70 factor (ECF subfamily)